MNLEKELETQKNSLANLEAILSAQEKERKRIADDLHDEIGATLTLVQKNLNLVLRPPTTRPATSVAMSRGPRPAV